MVDPSLITDSLQTVQAGRHLTREQSRAVFEEILSGRVADEAIIEWLKALTAKGETIEGVGGAAAVLSEKARRGQAHGEAIDTCGTGGDGISTFNASTAAAIIAAATGTVVAKHGNRSNLRVS